MAVELGAGYVSVVPAWEGGTAGAAKGLGGDALGAKVGGSLGGGITKALGVAGIGAALVTAVGVGLFKIGDSFDEQFDKIRVASGETGKELAGLKTDFKSVLTSVPTDFDSAGDAVAGLNQKLDLTGTTLQKRAEQFLELSRITGTDLTQNMESGTDALKAWQIAAGDQGSTLDMLFRASQESGASFSDLAGELSGNRAVFKTLGFSVGQATTVLAGLAKGGLDASDVMPALGRAVATAAKKGIPAQKVYRDLIASIKDAPNDTKAAAKAYDVLGARAGPKFAALVRSGQFSFDSLGESIAEGSETILGAGKDTQDFSEKFEMLKNRVLVGVEPLASRVFDAVGRGMDNLGPIFDTVLGGIKTVSTVFEQDGLAGIGRLIETGAPILGEKLASLGTKLYEWVQPQIEPLLGKAGELLGTLGVWIVGTGLPMLASAMSALAKAASDWLVDEALPYLIDQAPEFIDGITGWLEEDLTPAMREGGKKAGAALANGIYEGTKSNIKKTMDLLGAGGALIFGGKDEKVDPLRERALGGPVSAGSMYLVGEEGPELFAAGRNGTIIPNHKIDFGAPSGMGASGPTLIVQQHPGEDVISAGMRALRWHDTIQQQVASR